MADGTNSRAERPTVLYQEHLYLGAKFDGKVCEGLALPARYGTGEGETIAFHDGAALADLSGTASLLLSGAPAQAFCEAAFAGRKLAVGEARFEPALGGDGTLMSVPLLARTGDAEYVLWDASPRADLLARWLEFLSGVSQDGFAPYQGLSREDVAGRLVPLLLWGPAARHVLSDYVESERDLPAQAYVRDCRLDRIPAVVCSVPAGEPDCYLALVPPDYARTIWRSLLSFEEVVPVGEEALLAHAEGSLGWLPWVEDADRVTPSRKELEGYGLLRAEGDFVGARSL